VLGALFVVGTAYEWYDLIYHRHLTISRNLFGSTYFTLVGFHAAHVTVGLILLSVIFGLTVRGRIGDRPSDGITVASWYWHFVDGVWVVVFTLVYIVPRGMA
jgi:cytochrome c oxidase subunit 3/cytochrome o ubiquinol oxidase subunit 3